MVATVGPGSEEIAIFGQELAVGTTEKMMDPIAAAKIVYFVEPPLIIHAYTQTKGAELTLSDNIAPSLGSSLSSSLVNWSG